MIQIDEKTILRKVILEKRRSLSARERREKSRLIVQRLMGLEEFRQGRVIHLFLSFRGEVITDEVVHAALSLDKEVVVPVVGKTGGEVLLSALRRYPEEVAPGAHGIPEPRPEFIREVAPERVDLFVLPGVAFDRSGNRLGYGGGYYDRILDRLDRPKGSHRVPRVALAFECQLVEQIPASIHDVRVHQIVTETQVIACLRPGEQGAGEQGAREQGE